MFGVVMPNIRNTMTSSSTIRGICRACAATPYNPIIVSIEDDMENEPARIQQILDHRVEGIISFTGCQNPIYKKINKTGIPVIAADRYYSKCGLDGVVIDHYEATSKLLHHLLESGYTRIAMFTRKSSSSRLSTIFIREKAFLDFHTEHFNTNRLIYWFQNGEEEIEDIKLKLMTLKARFPNERIAIFVTEMYLLQAVDWAFKLVGMRYPDDIALCGYILREDIQNKFTLITTISQSLDFLSQKAFQLMRARIDGEELPFPQKVVIPAELQIRASTTANLPVDNR